MTIKEIAKLANVSPATVSNVVNNRTNKVSEEVRNRILKIIKEVDYVPNSIAKSLRKNKTNTIGVFAEDIKEFSTPGIITGINKYAEKAGLNILLSDLSIVEKTGANIEKVKEYRKEINEALNILKSAKVDGIIYIAWQDRDIGDLVSNIDIPLVYSFCYSQSHDRSWVSYDNLSIMTKIMEDIIALNHNKIALAWGGENCRPAEQRFMVYKSILSKYGIKYRKEYTRNGDWSFADGKKFYRYFVSLPDPPTAIVFMNDEMAAGAIYESMSTDKKVLDEISIVGFNNMDYTQFIYPRITTAKIPLEDIGYKSAELLVDTLNDNIDSKQIILPCELISGNSLRPRI